MGPAQLFSATLRSTTSTKSDDRPPPYDDELPPPYNEAIKMTLHTREEECTLKKNETTFVKMCIPSTSNSQPDVVQPSTSCDEEQTQSAVQIVIASPEDSSSAHTSESNEEGDQEDISRNNSPTFNSVIVQNSSDVDEIDGRRKKEHLKHVSMTVVL